MFSNPLQVLSDSEEHSSAVSFAIAYEGAIIGFCAGSAPNVLDAPISALVPVLGQFAPAGIELPGFVHKSLVTTQT
jgi:hypothetical protein